MHSYSKTLCFANEPSVTGGGIGSDPNVKLAFLK